MSSLVLLFILKLINMSILIVYSCTTLQLFSEAKTENDQIVEDKQLFLINSIYDNIKAEYDERMHTLSSSVVAKKHRNKRLVKASSSINNSTIEFKPTRSSLKESNNRAILDSKLQTLFFSTFSYQSNHKLIHIFVYLLSNLNLNHDWLIIIQVSFT